MISASVNDQRRSRLAQSMISCGASMRWRASSCRCDRRGDRLISAWSSPIKLGRVDDGFVHVRRPPREFANAFARRKACSSRSRGSTFRSNDVESRSGFGRCLRFASFRRRGGRRRRFGRESRARRKRRTDLTTFERYGSSGFDRRPRITSESKRTHPDSMRTARPPRRRAPTRGGRGASEAGPTEIENETWR